MFHTKFAAIAASVIGMAALSAPSASATVVLTFDDGDANPTVSTPLAPGANFTVFLKLTSTGEQVSGVNYDVLTQGAGVGRFKLVSRSLTNPPSLYPDQPFKSDAEVSAAAKVLSPDTGFNLGGSTVTGVTTTGTFQVASLTFQVLAGTLGGTYTLKTEAAGGEQNNQSIGYNGGLPSFQDFPFDSHATYTVTVTPEPASMALVGLLGGGILMRRRRA